jgi:hypothetical protein
MIIGPLVISPMKNNDIIVTIIAEIIEAFVIPICPPNSSLNKYLNKSPAPIAKMNEK